MTMIIRCKKCGSTNLRSGPYFGQFICDECGTVKELYDVEFVQAMEINKKERSEESENLDKK